MPSLVPCARISGLQHHLYPFRRNHRRNRAKLPAGPMPRFNLKPSSGWDRDPPADTPSPPQVPAWGTGRP